MVRPVNLRKRLAQRLKGCPDRFEDDLTAIWLRRLGKRIRKVRQAAIFQQLRLLQAGVFFDQFLRAIAGKADRDLRLVT